MVKIVKSCCVTGCKNINLGNDSGVQFFKFPDAKNAKKRWLEAIRTHLKNDKWEPDASSLVCSVHFVSGNHNSNEWHPDYAPSVFRSLRSVRPKARNRLIADYEEIPPKKIKTPTVKRLQQSSIRRTSLATTTRLSKPSKSSANRKSTGSILSKNGATSFNSSIPKIVDVRTEKASFSEDSDMSIPSLPTTNNSEKSKKYKARPKSKRDDFESHADDSDTDSMTKAKPSKGNKMRKTQQSYSGEHRLKNLSVVLERTPMGKMKSGNVVVKEEPSSEQEDSEYYEYPLVQSVDQCKKCATLEQKLKRQEDAHKRALLNEKRHPNASCRRCPVLEHKLKRAETEIDTMLEAKLNKCQKCTSLEQKIKKLENSARKLQGEISKLQGKLSSIEITEDSFKKSKHKVKQFTGFPNHETLMIVFNHVKDSLPDVGIKSLTPFQMFVIVLMKIKLDFPFWDLTYRFGTTPNLIQSFYPQYVSVLESLLSHAVLWPKSNLRFRLEVLVSNFIANFAIIQAPVKVETLMVEDTGSLTEQDKLVRLCASIYHISQLVSSNHHQQLLKILKSKSETDRVAILKESGDTHIDNEEGSPKEIHRKDLPASKEDCDDVDDSDIFFEDLTKDILPIGLNRKESLDLECRNLQKEIDQLTIRLSTQMKFYTGLRNFQVFNNMLSFVAQHANHLSQDKLNCFQQLHMILMRLKLNLEVQDLSYMFNVDADHIVYLSKNWLDIMSSKLARYIDWPAGIEDTDSEKRLQGSVKLKYQILWSPHLAPRNKETGRDKEKLDSGKLLRACAALYNIEDIEVMKDEPKPKRRSDLPLDEQTEEDLSSDCTELRSQLSELRSHSMTNICSYLKSDSLNDSMVEYYTGFPSYQVLNDVFERIVPNRPESKKILTPFQQFIIVLVRLKLNLATTDVGARFGVSQSHTHKLMQDWLSLIHARIAPYISWPDDDEDAKYFTEILRKTYAYIRPTCNMTRTKLQVDDDCPILDIPTLVCGGLFNMGKVLYVKDESDSEFDSFDEDW